MADPAAGGEDEHSRFLSSSAIEWTTKPVSGFLQICNEPILSSEVSHHVSPRLQLCHLEYKGNLLLQGDEDVQLERRGDLLAPLKVHIYVVLLRSSLAPCLSVGV